MGSSMLAESKYIEMTVSCEMSSKYHIGIDYGHGPAALDAQELGEESAGVTHQQGV